MLVSGSPASQGAPPRLATERIDGRNYVPLPALIRYYGFEKQFTRDDKSIVLRKKYASLRLKVDGEDAYVLREGNEAHLWLSYVPIQNEETVYVSELDVIKTLDPVLRPWAVPEFKIRTIMIDPGHGGFDKGTEGVSPGIVEKTFTLDTAKRLEKYLKQAGFRTLMTRRTDEYIALEDRADQANVSSADLFVSIHYNSAAPDHAPKGIETYCLTPAGASSSGKSDVSMNDFQIHPGNSRDNLNMLLGYCVQHSICKSMETTDRGVKRARFVVIRDVKKPGILVECGFLSNSGEEKRVRSENYRENLAKAISDGIQKFCGFVNPKKAPPVQLRN